jgi:nitrate/TMAO reductase-like tetraheme cytochrome c subunit
MKKLVAILGAAALVFVFQARLSAGEHAAVGPEKCKMCHKIEYDSWAKTKHASADPKTTCETCHGNGGDYWKMSVMKDPAKAKEAGLIAKPDKATCLKCHKAAEFKDEMLTQVHAKKPGK